MNHHRRVQSAIIESIRAAGITGMDLYRVHNRLFMIMETTDDFSFERKEKMDAEENDGAGVGEANVDLPATTAWQSAGGKMGTDGSYF